MTVERNWFGGILGLSREIVQKTIEMASTFPTTLVGDDTDLLVLLLYHYDTEATNHPIFFLSEPKKKEQCAKVGNILETKSKLGPDLCNNILFVLTWITLIVVSYLHKQDITIWVYSSDK